MGQRGRGVGACAAYGGAGISQSVRAIARPGSRQHSQRNFRSAIESAPGGPSGCDTRHTQRPPRRHQGPGDQLRSHGLGRPKWKAARRVGRRNCPPFDPLNFRDLARRGSAPLTVAQFGCGRRESGCCRSRAAAASAWPKRRRYLARPRTGTGQPGAARAAGKACQHESSAAGRSEPVGPISLHRARARLPKGWRRTSLGLGACVALAGAGLARRVLKPQDMSAPLR